MYYASGRGGGFPSRQNSFALASAKIKRAGKLMPSRSHLPERLPLLHVGLCSLPGIARHVGRGDGDERDEERGVGRHV